MIHDENLFYGYNVVTISESIYAEEISDSTKIVSDVREQLECPFWTNHNQSFQGHTIYIKVALIK